MRNASSASSATTPLYRLWTMAIGVWTTRFLLRTAGFQRTVVWLGSLGPICKSKDHPDSRWPREIEFVNGKPFGATCLDRSVFLWFVLRQHGITGDLRIGVANTEGTIVGHAWVEADGTVLNDDPDIASRFAVFNDDPVGIVFQ